MSPFEENDLFPAPAEKTILNRIIDEVQSSLETRTTGNYEEEQLRLYLADLLVSRGSNADFLRAQELYNQLIQAGTIQEIRAKTQVGRAELYITSSEPKDWDQGITLALSAYESLRVLPEDFFTHKAQVVQAELRMKRGQTDDYEMALQILNKVIESSHSGRYFKIRASVGKSEIVLYFYPGTPKDRQKEIQKCLQLCSEALRYSVSRPTDYFTMKLKLIMAELMIALPEADESRARSLLYSVVETKEGNFDLRARAMLNLAQMVNPVTALRFLDEIGHMEGLDSYLQKKAEWLEAEIKSKSDSIYDPNS